jgi:hypothetical protein
MQRFRACSFREQYPSPRHIASSLGGFEHCAQLWVLPKRAPQANARMNKIIDIFLDFIFPPFHVQSGK